MDVTPSELRDSDIKEAFRGYSRDEVDELLERAAVALENLNDRVQQISGRVSSAETNASRNREHEDIIQRTMIMAQKAADDAVAEAETRARGILQDAEARAAAAVQEAETRAVASAEAERQRVEAEVRELAGRRDALSQDVATLESYREEARARVRRVFEDELAGLEELDATGGRPDLSEVVLPEPDEGVLRREETWSASAQTAAIDSVEPFPAPAPEAADPLSFDDPELPPDWTSGPVRIAGRDEGEAREQPAGLYDFVEPDEPVEAEVLDDDAFFATLREAVSDEAPLGPREQGDEFFDQDQTDPGTRRRRRRRG